MGGRLDWPLAAGCGRRRMKRRGSPMETHRKAYTAPVSEIVPAAQDVVTASAAVNTWDEYITVTENQDGKTWEHTYPNPNYKPPVG